MPAHRPSIAANLALALLSAALTAALFLVVLLLINGWGHSADRGAAVVTAMPVTAAITLPRAAAPPSPVPAAAAGRSWSAGGLSALALLPGRGLGLALPPQVLIGAGLALALGALTRTALGAACRSRSTAAGRSPRATPASSSGCSC